MPPPENSIYDTVIIGAGLAGLSAAYELNQKHCLILEKDDRPGGRIHTRWHNDIPYELGALFTIDPDVLPFPFTPSTVIQEDGAIGFFHDGTLYNGQSGAECLIAAGVSPDRIDNFLSQDNNLPIPPGKFYDSLNSFFRVIHPSKIEDAVKIRQTDALARFDTHHLSRGNQELIEAYIQNINNPLQLNTRVLSIKEESDYVRIQIDTQNQKNTIFSKTAIISAPAPCVVDMVANISSKCHRFLKQLRHGGGTVVAMIINDIEFDEFSYIVTTHLPVNTIFKHKTKNPQIHIITCYFVAEASSALAGLPDKAIVEKAFDCLTQIHPYTGRITPGNILKSEVHHWQTVGPIISNKAYDGWDHDCIRPSDRVFLCGDYTNFDHTQWMPYGMTAAILSGRQSAATVKQFLTNH